MVGPLPPFLVMLLVVVATMTAVGILSATSVDGFVWPTAATTLSSSTPPEAAAATRTQRRRHHHLPQNPYPGSSSLLFASTTTTPIADLMDSALSSLEQTTSSTSSISSSKADSSWTNFDYRAHWYPVIWARDLIPNEPTKVTVFDVDYVVAKVVVSSNKNDNDKDGSAKDYVMIMAMEDRCPHKAAALSEGRVTTTGHFQCAYHGYVRVLLLLLLSCAYVSGCLSFY